ncbi:methyltransferase domain-containing protein [Nocardia sp. NPDC059691]|uniref:methyltransferase domain-containing protein n=1 Tax=Nocardia sp. NPDC059691 TaxID=3346908 RepID=UPI0036B90C45
MTGMAESFDAVADAHDHARWDLAPARFDAAVLAALSRFASRGGAPALFLGSGSGREAAAFVRAGRQVVLVDISARMLSLAKARYRDSPLVDYRRQSATEFLDDTDADYPFISAVGELLGYVRDHAALLTRIRTRLGDSGTCVFTWVDAHRLAQRGLPAQVCADGTAIFTERDEPPLRIRGWSQAHMHALLGTAGLDLVEEIAPEAVSPRRGWTVTPSRTSDGSNPAG